MIQDTRGWISVHDVARQMGVELSNEQAWQVGASMRGIWKLRVGTPPLKDNRTKKIGVGSHCFALYPPSWRGEIALCVGDVTRFAPIHASQLEMHI